jgi:hypothetical protein
MPLGTASACARTLEALFGRLILGLAAVTRPADAHLAGMLPLARCLGRASLAAPGAAGTSVQ